jgi:hypothetical protein
VEQEQRKKGNPRDLLGNGRVSLENVKLLRCCLAGLLSRERQEGDVPAPLDGNGNLPLVAGTVAGNAAGKDLAALGDEEFYGLEVLIVDKGGLVDAEPADLFPDLEPLLVGTAGARVPGSAALG